MTSLHPAYLRSPQSLRQRLFQVQSFPAAQRVEVGGQLGQQALAEAASGAACLVTGPVLIKAQVRIAARLTDVEAPRVGASAIVEKDDVDGVSRSGRVARRRRQRTRRALGQRHPGGTVVL